MKAKVLASLKRAARRFYTTNDPAHDWDHIGRAFAYAQRLAKAEKADEEIVLAAILFHDCVKHHVGEREADRSSELSAQKAGEILAATPGFPREKIPAVKRCIHEHSLCLAIKPQTIESQVVQDADRLDSIGMIAVMRIMAHCGILGGRLFSWEDPLCEKGRQTDRKAFGLDWVPERLTRVAATISTRTGKKIARKLDANLRRFISMAKDEIAKFDAEAMKRWEKA